MQARGRGGEFARDNASAYRSYKLGLKPPNRLIRLMMFPRTPQSKFRICKCKFPPSFGEQGARLTTVFQASLAMLKLVKGLFECKNRNVFAIIE